MDIAGEDPWRILRGEAPTAPLRARLFRSGRPADIVGTTDAVLKLVSLRFGETLTSFGMTGWTTIPVHPDAALPDDLELLVVTGRCGPVYSSTRNPLPGMPALGDFIDPRNWDGSPTDIVSVKAPPAPNDAERRPPWNAWCAAVANVQRRWGSRMRPQIVYDEPGTAASLTTR